MPALSSGENEAEDWPGHCRCAGLGKLIPCPALLHDATEGPRSLHSACKDEQLESRQLSPSVLYSTIIYFKSASQKAKRAPADRACEGQQSFLKHGSV